MKARSCKPLWEPLPEVDLLEYICSVGFICSSELDVVDDPLDEMVFESSFDKLMQEVGGQEVVNVTTRKVIRERLNMVCELVDRL